MKFFEHVVEAPLDPILGLNIRFNADPRENKVNLGVGTYKTAELKSIILNSVKQAESLLLKREINKDYLPIDGLKEYVLQTKALVFGSSHLNHIYGAQTVGGTAALAVGARFLKEIGLKKVFLSSPTWSNHNRIFHCAGLEVASYSYYNLKKQDLDFSALTSDLNKMKKESIVLWHLCCHNPTGCDPTFEQWREICEIMKKRKLFAFFDFAYQGFGEDLEKDAAPLSLFLQNSLEFAVAVSHAKNFGLYGERCGVLFMACHEEEEALSIGSRIKVIIRSLYSNPPRHGAEIIATILQDEELKQLWIKELEEMRGRIDAMRNSLVLGLQSKAASSQFDFLLKQRGMFSYIGLNETQVEKLIADYGIYMTKKGRINVAGLNSENLDYVIDAILKAYNKS
jgi:aspartate aminotransferase